MPRLSVDLDLVFADHSVPRDAALARINEAVRQTAERLEKRGLQVHAPAAAEGETKLFVRRGPVQVKIEVNVVMRGTVRPVRRTALTAAACDVLTADAEIPVVSLEDVYGGKLVAALDRQHPRDLFDVMQLFAHEGITPGIRRAFVVYLASSNRPVHEVLFAPLRDIRHDFDHTFQGMTAEPVPLEALLAVRERLVREIQQGVGRERAALPAFNGRGCAAVGAPGHRSPREPSCCAMEAAEPVAVADDPPQEVCRAGRGAGRSVGQRLFKNRRDTGFRQGASR